MTRGGRWAPGLHAAAVAVGAVAAFLPVTVSRISGGPIGEQESRYSFWEVAVEPAADPTSSFSYLGATHDPGLTAAGLVFVVALLAVAAAGALCAAARRRPELAGRARTASAASAAAVAAVAAVVCGQAYALTLPRDFGEVVMLDVWSTGAAVPLLVATAVLAVSGAALAARPEPLADLDTPPLGLPVIDPDGRAG